MDEAQQSGSIDPSTAKHLSSLRGENKSPGLKAGTQRQIDLGYVSDRVPDEGKRCIYTLRSLIAKP